MSSQFADLLDRLARPEQPGTFSVIPVSDLPAYYVGRDDSGCTALLIRTAGSSTKVPLVLAGIEARYSVACRIEEHDSDARTEHMTVVICRSQDRVVERHFLNTMEFLASALGPLPTVTAVSESIDRLVDLFQRLSRPSRRPVVGLIGELLVIRAATNPSAAVRAWRVDRDERYDFTVGDLRIDAKATSSDRRSHEVSFDQANPAPGTMGVLMSFMVQPSGGGFSLADLLADIEARIDSHDLVLRLRTVVADTLGRDMHSSLGWAFDLARATASTKIYDVSTIPAIRPPLPAGVSGVRFMVDLGSCRELSSAQIDTLAHPARALLPP